MLLEAGDEAGGLSRSHVDARGFTWDMGVHVLHSHYAYFDRVMDDLLGPNGWAEHERKAWIWMRERFIPYPLQHNLHRLPAEELERCLDGLLTVSRTPARAASSFHEWLLATFGEGIADTFLVPYNRKAWGYEPELLGAGWVGDRVAVADLSRVLHNLAERKDDPAWGPNNRFRFPARGGTGEIWRACARRLPRRHLRFGHPVVAVDVDRHVVATAAGETISYDELISTVPLRDLIRLSDQRQLDAAAARGLLFSSSHVVGIGLAGTPPERLAEKSWIYFPEDSVPFHRVTVFSNYSRDTVPTNGPHWSLLAEVTESNHKPVAAAGIVNRVIDGLLATRLVERRSDVVSTWHARLSYGYPTPGRERDAALAVILPHFAHRHVHSRGRFGLWKYEVSNQDHSFMQGVEIVEHLLYGRREITATDPSHTNGRHHPWPFERWVEDDARGNVHGG